jgi:hypothetical protein
LLSEEKEYDPIGFDDLLPLLQRRYYFLSLVVGACIYSIAGSFQVILNVLHILPYSDKLLNQRLTILFYYPNIF